MSRFKGKVALVTGAGGLIGAATAAQLALEGAAVALLDRRGPSLEPVEQGCRGFGAEVLALPVDQVDRVAVGAAVDRVAGELGPVDVLFANAGYGQFGSFLEVDDASWTKHVAVNLDGTFHVCQAVARQLVARRSPGAIVVNASSGAHVYSDRLFAYCATKAAVRMMATGMAAELGPHRIRVNCVMPGVVETGMTGSMLADERHRQHLLSETPVGRLGRPEDVADLVAFLLSDEAAYIDGAAIPIDGGQTIHGHPRWFRTDYRHDHAESWEVAGG